MVIVNRVNVGVFCDDLGLLCDLSPCCIAEDRGIGLAAFRRFFFGADAMVNHHPPPRRPRKSIRELHAEFRGLYTRVARKAGVDPSYVSRVARGERKSEQIEELLRSELKRILKDFI